MRQNQDKLQAKKITEKLVIDDIQPSNRKYPGIIFRAERECGDQILNVEHLSKSSDEGVVLFQDISFTLTKEIK